MMDKRPISDEQLWTLIILATPTMVLLGGSGRSDRALIKRGFLHDGDGGITIGPAGLRRLADEMEKGRVATVMEAKRAEMERKRAEKAAKAGRM
jgi:hypothetical protein